LKESSGAIISKNHIANNTALNYAYGIKLYSFTDASIHNNTIVNSSDYGVLIDSSGACSMINITDNRITNNIGGIRLNFSSGVVVTYNTISGNNIGINLTSSSDTAIYNNYFANTQNAYDDGTNIWNTTNTTGPNIVGGSEIGGNYWSDYTGTDGDGDGFGDEPYDNITYSTGMDHLPLVMPMCGDITGDGNIDTVDLLHLLECVVTGTHVPACIGDIDGNGHINVLDARLLMGYLHDPEGYLLNCGCGDGE
jgi:parallel beta-helix repeat protein